MWWTDFSFVLLAVAVTAVGFIAGRTSRWRRLRVAFALSPVLLAAAVLVGAIVADAVGAKCYGNWMHGPYWYCENGGDVVEDAGWIAVFLGGPLTFLLALATLVGVAERRVRSRRVTGGVTMPH